MAGTHVHLWPWDGVGRRGREAQMTETHVHLWPWDGVGRRGQGGSDGGDILYTCG